MACHRGCAGLHIGVPRARGRDGLASRGLEVHRSCFTSVPEPALAPTPCLHLASYEPGFTTKPHSLVRRIELPGRAGSNSWFRSGLTPTPCPYVTLGCSMLTRLPSVSKNETYRPTPGISIGSPRTLPPARSTRFIADTTSSTAMTIDGYWAGQSGLFE